MLEFLLRLVFIFSIDSSLTRFIDNFSDATVTVSFENCVVLVLYILMLFIAGKFYLRNICCLFIALGIAAAGISYMTPILDSMYRQGFVTYVLVCQFIMCFFQADKWLKRLPAFPTILITFTALYCDLPYFHFTIAFLFYMAGNVLSFNEKLEYSFRVVYNMLNNEGVIKTIEHLYRNRQIGWILKVFWLIKFVDTVHWGYLGEIPVNSEMPFYIVAASNSILQYFALLVLLIDAAFIVLWIVKAILKWSVRHRVGEIEIGELENRSKITDIISIRFGLYFINCLSSVSSSIKEESLFYPTAGILLFMMCCSNILNWALLLCNKTLQTLTTSLWENIWAHVRAILLTLFLLWLLINASSTLSIESGLTKLVIFHPRVLSVIRTIKILAVYTLYAYDFLSSNGIEQPEEKVYKLDFVVDIITIVYAIGVCISLIWDALIMRSYNILGFVLFATLCKVSIWNLAKQAWNSSQRRRADAKILKILADATKEQLKIRKDKDERCAICFKLMSSAKITRCGHYFHYSCLRKWLHEKTTCPLCMEQTELKLQKDEETELKRAQTVLKRADTDMKRALTEMKRAHTELRRAHTELKRVETELKRAETKQKHTETHEDEKYTWFKDKFLDSRRKLKKEIYQKLMSFPWLCGTYGLTGPNSVIGRPHLFLTVKRGMNHIDVLRELKETFSCEDPNEYFELLEEPKRKPNFKHLMRRHQNGSSVESASSTSDLPVQAVPGGRVLACSSHSDPNHMRLRENDRAHLPDVLGSGTLTMFCCKNGQHYALTCFHVGGATDEKRSEVAFNKEEDIRKMRSSFSFYEEHAKNQKYYFEKGSELNNNMAISFGDDGSNSKLLGDFHKCRFDDECDILSVKICDDIEIDCKLADVTRPDWDEIWNELYERIIEKTGQNPVRVEKICLPSARNQGRMVETEFGYKDEDGPIFHDTTVVKGDSGSFLADGDSGSLVCFLDKKKQKQVFAYGVLEVDEYDSPEQRKSSTLTGPYAICLNLETALQKLELEEAGCFNVCGRN